MKALRRIASAGGDGVMVYGGGCRVIPPFYFRMAVELAKNAE